MIPLGLLCSMASQPPWRCRCGRLQLKVSKEEHLVCQPISHQHGLVEVMSPLRFAILFCTGCVTLSTVNIVLAEICKDVRFSTTPSICGSGSTSTSTTIPSGIFVHSRHWFLPLLSSMRKCGPSLPTRTRPAIEFVSGEESPCPASSSISSSIRSLSTSTLTLRPI